MNKSRNIYLDLFKYVLCFFVICIHLVGETYSHFPIYRLAVPMFFLISGYFAYTKNNEEQSAKTLIKRTLKYMAMGFLVLLTVTALVIILPLYFMRTLF